MRLISWNVNGIRSILGKGFFSWISRTDADIICLQETKIGESDLDEHVPTFPGWDTYWHSAERKGYSGVAILTRQQLLSVQRGLGFAEFDQEGRVITAEYPSLFIVNIYAPNSQTGYARIPFRLAWDEALRTYLASLRQKKSVIVCGDFNVAHTDLDVGIPDASRFPGCSPEERGSFHKLLGLGFVDTFRHLHQNERKYSWWSYAEGARFHNHGLRFDYVLVSEDLKQHIRLSDTHTEVLGSDHGPVSLSLEYALQGTPIRTAVLPSGQFGFGI